MYRSSDEAMLDKEELQIEMDEEMAGDERGNRALS